MSVNPYRNVSCFDFFRREKHPDKMKTCALSNQKIEIPNRVFSTRGDLHYDVYRLAIWILNQQEPSFPSNFNEEEKARFYKFFHLKEDQFEAIWGAEILELYGRCGPEVGFSEGLKASAREWIFGGIISRSHRSKLNQYFPEPLLPYKSFYVRE